MAIVMYVLFCFNRLLDITETNFDNGVAYLRRQTHQFPSGGEWRILLHWIGSRQLPAPLPWVLVQAVPWHVQEIHHQ